MREFILAFLIGVVFGALIAGVVLDKEPAP